MSFTRLSIVLALACTVACGHNARTSARTFIQRGDGFVAEGKYESAVIAYRNAVKQQPSWAEAHRKLGEAYEAVGKGEDAYSAYLKATELDASDLSARLGAARLLLAGGMTAEARLRAEEVLERSPHNAEAHIIVGRSLRDDPAAAEQEFLAAVASEPNSPQPHVALGEFLFANNRAREAETELQKAVAGAPDDELANRAIAWLHLSTGRSADAEAFLRRAAAAPGQRYRSALALADYLIANGRYADARQALTRASSDERLKDAVRLRTAVIEFSTGSRDDAYRLLDKILKREPNAEAMALKARYLAADHRQSEAMTIARAAIDLNPRLPAAQYMEGSLALESGRLDDADRAFSAVLQAVPADSATRLQLARTKLALGRTKEAVELAEGAGPSFDARLTLARARRADGDLAGARDILTQLAWSRPNAAEPQLELGSLSLENGQAAPARDHFERALSVAPDSVDAVVGAATAALADGQASAARARVATFLRAHPADARVLQVGAKASEALGDPAAAEQMLKQAVQLAPSSADPSAALGELYVRRGAFDDARAVFEKLAAQLPQSAAARISVALVLEASGRSADARSWYEQALAIDRADPLAANNLARLYVNEGSHLDEAVQLGIVAVNRRPTDAETHDTLGLAYYKAGRFDAALRELDRAVSLDGKEPAYQQHRDEVHQALDAQPPSVARRFGVD